MKHMIKWYIYQAMCFISCALTHVAYIFKTFFQHSFVSEFWEQLKQRAEQRNWVEPGMFVAPHGSVQIVIRMQERNFILKLTHGRNLWLKLEMLNYCWWHLDVWRDVTSCASVKKYFQAPPKLLLLCSYLHLSSANRPCRENWGMGNTWNMPIMNHSNPKIRG